jgi:YtfJ family uncharacterized protein
MKHWLVLVVVTVVALSAHNAWSDLQIGQVPETVVLQDKQGGRVDGSSWSSEEVRGKVSAFFYVDPDVSDLNDAASEAMKAEAFPLDQYQSFAVINMAATWKPNFAINSRLKKKQEQYPNTIYVRDNEKVLVEAWGISDENNCLLVFDKQGQLVFRKDGQLDEAEIKTMIEIIHDNLTK